ncbi:hypothetical protein TRM7615_04406 [Falsiruegeria mediterranea M17]|uniref:Uncharacterized protein n=1 Tax=Falsiruegeria mediterranea M17 TaxID=1200281 RepID=A0A2R8CER5_9RHOB|nr:hypothetical protein TRM7615_04406 [Falsiruegeria mediterranea M17]
MTSITVPLWFRNRFRYQHHASFCPSFGRHCDMETHAIGLDRGGLRQ